LTDQPRDKNLLNDPARLQGLHESGLLDTLPERSFDRLTELAQRLLHVPVVLISLVDKDRQFFKSAQGLLEPWASARQTPLSHSFCQHVVTTDAPLCISDALTVPLLAKNGAVIDLGVVAYLGLPLHTPNGETIGSFCVIDSVPRTWQPDEIQTLEELTAIAEDEIALRFHLQRSTEAEVEIRESERQFRSTFENAAVGIAHLSLTGKWLQVNQRLCDIVGYGAGELCSRTFQEITHPDDLAGETIQIEALLRGEIHRQQIEQRYLTKEGRTVWVNLTVTLQRDEADEPAYFIAVVEDISGRKAAEARLKLLAEGSIMLVSSLDYAQTVQQLAELITVWFADWCAIDLVTSAETLETIAVAHQDRDVYALLRQVRPQRLDQLRSHRGRGKVLRTGQSEFYPQMSDTILGEVAHSEAHLQNLRAINPASVLIVPLRIRETTVGTVILTRSESSRPFDEEELHFAEDLAGRIAQTIDNVQLYRGARSAEADLRILNETLEQQVIERTKELSRRNQELDRFAYIASHDLKAPLRAIDNLATWITEDAAALLPTTSQAHLTKLRDRVMRMEKLLNDLLAYSRSDRHRGAPELVDTNQLVREIAALIAPPTFRIMIPSPLPTLVTLRVPLETVLRNLLGNAIKHHNRPDGRALISASDLQEDEAPENNTQDESLSGVKKRARFIKFCVTDDGPGIDSAYHERIFEIFETLQPRDRVEGSGIGLAVVKKIVESHQGTIVVQSSAEGGTTFSFTWPKGPEPSHGEDLRGNDGATT